MAAFSKAKALKVAAEMLETHRSPRRALDAAEMKVISLKQSLRFQPPEMHAFTNAEIKAWALVTRAMLGLISATFDERRTAGSSAGIFRSKAKSKLVKPKKR